VEAAALLLARGADAHAADARGWGAAHHAAAAGARELELVALLRGAGALELAARDRAGRSAVQVEPARRAPPAHTCTRPPRSLALRWRSCWRRGVRGA
jgi:ankyrin repeat protein